jgi:hypothetical protein
VVHRYTAKRDSRLHLTSDFSVSPRSTDGIAVTLSRDGQTLLSRSGRGPIGIDLHLSLRKGQALSLSVSPRANARGDLTRYRIRIYDEDRCRKGPSAES